MSIIDSLTDAARTAEDYNDMNLARLCLTAADEIERLRAEVVRLTPSMSEIMSRMKGPSGDQ